MHHTGEWEMGTRQINAMSGFVETTGMQCGLLLEQSTIDENHPTFFGATYPSADNLKPCQVQYARVYLDVFAERWTPYLPEHQELMLKHIMKTQGHEIGHGIGMEDDFVGKSGFPCPGSIMSTGVDAGWYVNQNCVPDEYSQDDISQIRLK